MTPEQVARLFMPALKPDGTPWTGRDALIPPRHQHADPRTLTPVHKERHLVNNNRRVVTLVCKCGCKTPFETVFAQTKYLPGHDSARWRKQMREARWLDRRTTTTSQDEG